MGNKDEYYIGWKDELPEKNQSFIKKFLFFLFPVLLALLVIVVILEKPFNDHIYKLGDIESFTGIYHSTPTPILTVSADQLPAGVDTNMLLVGYGKFGVDTYMKEIEGEHGYLSGKKITLEGTLISGAGRSLLELTKKQNSLVKVFPDQPIVLNYGRQMSHIELQGEIIDPKCYFGVMKPALGKVHKSCAIRCISGGIPPVLKSNDVPSNYYVLRNLDGSTIHKDVLDHIGIQVKIVGRTFSRHGWHFLYIDPESITDID